MADTCTLKDSHIGPLSNSNYGLDITSGCNLMTQVKFNVIFGCKCK